jgi:hypothetical protein
MASRFRCPTMFLDMLRALCEATKSSNQSLQPTAGRRTERPKDEL